MLSAISPNVISPAPVLSEQAATTSPKPVVSQSPASTASPAAPATTSSNASADTVKISNAGQQALQEARETPAQTTKEASHGDLQAKRLLAEEAAEKSSGGIG